jgi:SAM-dependent MidA family methyltransferase
MSNELDLRINAEIAERGAISFSRFMERALTEPDLGYYVTERVRAGREGDFITAPELHSLLGSALARMASEVWRRLGEPTTFRWVEYGAGSGALALALIAQLRRDGSPLINALEIQPIDVNTFRSEELRNAVTSEQQNGAPALVGAEAQPTAGMVIANEYLDALPFNIYVGRANAAHGVSERCVGLAADGLTRVWVERELDASEAQRVAEHLGAPLAEGQLAEACFTFDAWLHEVTTRITSGLVAVIDYGRDGVTLIAAIREAEYVRGLPRSRVVVLTGEVTQVARSYEAGADEVLAKPATGERLEQVLSQATTAASTSGVRPAAVATPLRRAALAPSPSPSPSVSPTRPVGN